MKTTKSELRHITGREAYRLYWEQVYKCRPRLSSIMAIDRNLEIITDSDMRILAYRYNVPEDMKLMVMNVGHWQIYDEEKQRLELLIELRIMIGRLKTEICLN